MKQFIAWFLLLGSPAGFAQEVTDFTLKNSVDGKMVSLTDYKSYAGVVVIFVSNDCPYDQYYLNRIKKVTNDYAGKMPVILINSMPGEAAEAMHTKAEQSGIAAPYLADTDQVAMKSLGATRNPEAFVLKNSSGKFSIVYRGAIDDNAQVEADVHQHYLRHAIDLTLEGKPVPNKEVRPVGCIIRKKS